MDYSLPELREYQAVQMSACGTKQSILAKILMTAYANNSDFRYHSQNAQVQLQVGPSHPSF